MNTTEVSKVQGIIPCGSYTYDRKNNTEMIVIPAGTTTYFDLGITTATSGGSRPQKFAVFAANAY